MSNICDKNFIPKAMSMSEIAIATTEDTLLFVGNWKGLQNRSELESYVCINDSLTIVPTKDTASLYNCCIVIPPPLTQKVVNISQGLVKTKQLLREKMFFGINNIVKIFNRIARNVKPSYSLTIPNHRTKMTKLPDKSWTFG